MERVPKHRPRHAKTWSVGPMSGIHILLFTTLPRGPGIEPTTARFPGQGPSDPPRTRAHLALKYCLWKGFQCTKNTGPAGGRGKDSSITRNSAFLSSATRNLALGVILEAWRHPGAPKSSPDTPREHTRAPSRPPGYLPEAVLSERTPFGVPPK